MVKVSVKIWEFLGEILFVIFCGNPVLDKAFYQMQFECNKFNHESWGYRK